MGKERPRIGNAPKLVFANVELPDDLKRSMTKRKHKTAPDAMDDAQQDMAKKVMEMGDEELNATFQKAAGIGDETFAAFRKLSRQDREDAIMLLRDRRMRRAS